MKPPNKVYILPSQYNLQYDNGGEEYIRKDALLEWLKEELEHSGPTTLVQHIINKINSL